MQETIKRVTGTLQVTAWGKLSAVTGHHSFFRAVRSLRV